LIFSRISRIFLLWYIVRKAAVVHKWYINGRHSEISIPPTPSDSVNQST